MNREELIALCLNASTPAEIEDAERKLRKYILQHPHDEAILDCGEALHMARTYPREHTSLQKAS